MKHRWLAGMTMLSLWLLAGPAGRAQAPAAVVPLPRAHAHNDYEHARPLLDALDHGFCSVEADVWPVDGQLLVAHTSNAVHRSRTLQALYLDPLRERAAAHGGRVYAGGPSLTLLIDFKADATNTYEMLRAVLRPYEQMLTAFHADHTETNAVTVIVTGNRPRALMEAESVRHAGYEGRPSDLEERASPHFMPLISDTWTKHFTWRGAGPLPDAERSKLRALVEKVHGQGKRIRFWSIPGTPAAWSELLDVGVDLINTDDLDGLRDFLLTHAVQKAK